MFIEDRIETPENVELRRKLAGIGLRFSAGIIDTLILGLAIYLPLALILFIMGAASVFGNGGVMETLAITLFILVAFCVYWGYFLLFELFRNGQTPGKKSMKIRVVRDEGQGLTLAAAFIRNLLRVVDGLGGYSVAGISMFFSSKVQRLGDMAAGTVVICEQMADYAASSDDKRHLFLDEALAADALQESFLKPEEQHLLSSYWARRSQLDPAARARLLPKLLAPILERRGETVDTSQVDHMEARVHQLLFAQQSPPADAGPQPPAPPRPSSPEPTP